MLVAQVPRGSDRWQQIGFSVPATEQFFRALPATQDRVFLWRREPSGEVVAERPRPIVYSNINVNHRIEFGAHHGDAYPTAGAPIIVVRELGLRLHLYMMLFPGEHGYAEMQILVTSRPNIGRGMRQRDRLAR